MYIIVVCLFIEVGDIQVTCLLNDKKRPPFDFVEYFAYIYANYSKAQHQRTSNKEKKYYDSCKAADCLT